MGSGSFAARLAVFIILATFLAALAAVTLWTREQSRRLDDAVTSQAGFVLSEAKAALEVQLNLGLALADLPQVDGLLNRARVALPTIQSVAVLDESGMVLFSTNAVEVGESLPQNPAFSSGASPGAVWSDDVAGERVYGVGLTTSFDTSAGAVLLRVPVGAMTERVRHYALTLGIGALAVGAPLAFAAWLCGLWLIRAPRRALSEVAEALEGLEAGRPVEEAGNAAVAGSSLGLPVPGFLAAVRRRFGVLEGAEREVSRLDELA
ncbi:hypothetical protein [Azospirillum sp.]|uniref:hypothetical protein n=1 Tax=Azospirillum sp. TaxID=34012 RepID=UPI0026256C13|nr:hypothetical protein [Azospirillum sp.]